MNPLITVIGPTATGKSDLAVALALHIREKFGKTVEIISADSRQIYKHLDIGTGKITKDEMQGITHHMLDILDPREVFSVFAYGKMVEGILDDIYSRGAIPILCGGTGFYIDAVVYKNVGAQTPPNLELQKELETLDIDALLDRLHTISKQKNISIAHVDTKNKRRVIRAIEILESGGTFAIKNTVSPYSLLQIGLDADTEILKERIQKRLDRRLDDGMIEESEKLLEKHILTHERMHTLGLEYRFISQLLKKEITLPEFKEKLFYAIWHYAKRQRVWFKRYIEVKWIKTVDEAKMLVDTFLSPSRNNSTR